MLEGQLDTTRDVAGEQVLMLSHGPGGFLGAMALLTDTPYRGSTFAVADTVLFELDGEELRRLAFTHGSLLRGFLPALEAVSGAVKGIERDREKLLAIGTLAAGLAHELNNPAAAAARGVATLREHERRRIAAMAAIAAGGRAGGAHRRPGRPRRRGRDERGARPAARPAGGERPRGGPDRRRSRRAGWRAPARSPPG